MSRLKHGVFWPPFLLLAGAVAYSAVDQAGFVRLTQGINGWILSRFSGVFAWTGLLSFATCVAAMASPIGNVRLGGPTAKPMLTPWNWAAISICTVTAVGILFWSTAEPLMHLSAPPASLGLRPGSPEAATFAMATMMLHWSFVPCAMYCLPAATFAFAFYNMRAPFSIASCLRPLLGRHAERAADPVDAVCLYALVAGMAASLATGILTLGGGFEHAWGFKSGPLSWTLINAAIVISFVASAVSGLHRGITFLSGLNMKMFYVLAGFILLFGPTAAALKLGGLGFADFARHFVAKNLFWEFTAGDPWPRSWTIFYWAVWLAWAPVTALFLGRVGRGYTMRAFLAVNFLVPAVFSALWMAVFSGSAIAMQTKDLADLAGALAARGPEAVVYAVFEALPAARLMIPVFLVCVFLSFVTSSDANTSVMAALSTCGVSAEESEPPAWMKVVWGGILGALALIMLCLCGVEGIKTLSYLGGFPALLLQAGVLVSFWRVALSPAAFDRMKAREEDPAPERILETV